jgi:hypothetical protein
MRQKGMSIENNNPHRLVNGAGRRVLAEGKEQAKGHIPVSFVTPRLSMPEEVIGKIN